jgi:hypothetical protein
MLDPVRHWSEVINSSWKALVGSLGRAESGLPAKDFVRVLDELNFDRRTARSILRKYEPDATNLVSEAEVIFDQTPLETFLEGLPGDSVELEPLPNTFSSSADGKCPGPITDEQLFALSLDQIGRYLAYHRQKVPVSPPVVQERPTLSLSKSTRYAIPEITGNISISNGSVREKMDKLRRDISEITGSAA